MTGYYFAYGSNTNETDWRRWCRNINKSPDGLQAVGFGFLPDMEVCFDYWSLSRNGGALNITEKPGHAVRGLIMTVDDRTWELLDRKEGAGARYERIEVTVIDDRGCHLLATTYRVRQEHRTTFVPPTPEYLEVVERGFAQHGEELPKNIRQAAEGKPADPMVDGFFVYGTLRRGECRHPFLERYGPIEVTRASATGRLFNLGPYPGMKYQHDASSHVVGEHIRVSSQSEAVKTLDGVEDFTGYGGTHSLFRRTIIPITTEARRSHHSWAYEFAGGVEDYECIESGDWRHR